MARVPQEGDVFRHTRRGSSYTVIGRAILQTGKVLNDNEELIIYRDEHGKLWVRSVEEFCDGRFVSVVSDATE